MSEIVSFVPNQLSRTLGVGQRVVGFAASKASERFGQLGATRNALTATVDGALRPSDDAIFGCEQIWSERALRQPPPEGMPTRLQQSVKELSIVPALKDARDTLLGALDDTAPLPPPESLAHAAQLSARLVQQAWEIVIPKPRPDSE